MKALKSMYCAFFLCICMVLLVPVTGTAATNSATIMYVGNKKTVKNFTVKSSKKKIVSIKESNGKSIITPLKTGEATLKYYKGKKLKKRISVLVVNKSDIKYNTKKLNLTAGKSSTVRAKAPKKCKITYSSTNKKVATVNKKGVIKGKNEGTCTITVKIAYKGAIVKTFKKKVIVNKKGAIGSPAVSNKLDNPSSSKDDNKGLSNSKPSDKTQNQTDDKQSNPSSGANTATLKDIAVTSVNKSVKEGYHFTLDDFIVYGIYSDGSKERIYNFRLTAMYTSTGGYYEVNIDAQGFNTKICVPVSPDGADDNYDPSKDNQPVPENVKAIGIDVIFAKTEIPEGYDFPLSDFTVYTVYSDGSRIPAAGFGFTTLYKDGWYSITVTCGGFEKVLKVKAAETISEPTLTKVKFELTSGSVKIGENLAPGQIKVTAFYSDGTQKDIKDFTHDFTPKYVPGKYTVNITWGNSKGTVTVTVVSDEAVLTDINIQFARNFLYLDEKPSKDDILVTGVYSDGSTRPITDFTFSFTPAKGHNQEATIIVTVAGNDMKFNVTCYDRDIPVGLHMTMNRSSIKINEDIDPSTIVLEATYRDGHTSKETDFTLDFTPKSSPGTYPVVLTFHGETLEFNITVTA